MDEFSEGDRVTWKSHGQEVEGTVKRKITSETEAGGRKVKASKDEPQYEVESDKTGIPARSPTATMSLVFGIFEPAFTRVAQFVSKWLQIVYCATRFTFPVSGKWMHKSN